jgi:outer membrane protein
VPANIERLRPQSSLPARSRPAPGRLYRVWRGAASAIVAAASVVVAGSIDGAAAGDETPKDDGPLLITLGANGVWGPRFEGARRNEIGPWPIISWRNANSKEWLDLPTDGIDYALVETENFRAGPVGYFRWQRDNATISQRGFRRFGEGRNSIDLSLEAGGFVEYWPSQWLRTRVELRETVVGADGLVALLSSDAVWKPDKAWTFSFGPRLSLADRRFMESYYGVTPIQSAATGLPAYAPSAGIRSYGVGAMVRYKMSEAWTTQVFADYQHLTGSAGDSPVINNRHGTPDQLLVGVGISYTFKAPW